MPDQVAGEANPPDRMLSQFDANPAVSALDRALADFVTSYGRATSSWVAVQLEYPQP